MSLEEIGVYVHIPFCKRKCNYCDFTSFTGMDQNIEKYIEAIKKEIINSKEFLKEKIIRTIYIGGGTPSYINEKYIVDILKSIKEIGKISKNVEITIEVNPGTANYEKLKSYKEAGVNRISIGLQSTNDIILNKIGRIHNYQEFINTYLDARNLFNNINVDLMLALPDQNIEDLEDSLNKVINLNPEHISVYSLILEENTKMYNDFQQGKINLPDEETERNMYWLMKNTLEKNEYIHYEISNFAKPGYESKHNMDCWNQKHYLGFGLGASSYIDNRRFSNIKNINTYIENIENEEYDKNIILEEEQTKEEQMNEFMILGLRKINGIDINKFYEKFNESLIDKYKTILDKLDKEKLIKINNNKVKLTNKGIDLANIVWEEFI